MSQKSVGRNAGFTNRILHRTMRVAVATVAAIGLSVPAMADPILFNGGFEEGDFTGWDLVDSSGFSVVQCPGPGPQVAEGFCSAALGTVDTSGTLSQTFVTQPGQNYALTFQFLWDGGVPSSFAASVNGASLFARVDPPQLANFGSATLLFHAAAPTSTVSFSFRDDPGFIVLDAVAVTLPEPASIALLGLGIGGLLLARRRRRA